MLGTIAQILNKFIPDKDAAAKAAVALESEFTKQMELKHSIIQAEERNGSGKWRVHLMYMCMSMVGLHFIMYDMFPFIVVSFNLDLMLTEAPENEHMWNFLKIGVGGYIGGRTVEKTTAWVKGKFK